jgi:hypothetical protein
MEPTFTGMAGRPDPTFTGMAGSEFTGISQAPAYNGRGMSGSEFTGISQADTLPSFTGMAGSEKDTKIAARTDTDVDTDGLESGASGFNFVNKEPTNENVPSEEELEQQGREENRFPHFYHHKNNTIFTTPGGDRYDYDDPDQRQRWLDLYKKEFDMPTPHDGGWWRKGPDGDEAMVEQDVAEGISVVKSDYDLDQMVLTFDIEGQRKQFTYWDYDEDFENAERRDVFDQLQRESWYKGLDHPTKMEILDAAYRAIRGLEPAEYRPTVGDEPLDEAGPFSYGAKKPRKGSVADLAAKKRKEQERGKQPIEPRDQMVGTARVVTNEDVESYLDEMRRAGYDIVTERATLCPECGGVAYANQMLAEKQDACYHKVKSRYKVWPSAYASGALVRCRKKGAKNWGNKSKK